MTGVPLPRTLRHASDISAVPISRYEAQAIKHQPQAVLGHDDTAEKGRIGLRLRRREIVCR
jgi:hypothetical protein